MAEYRLRSFSPWLASISLDAAVRGDVVQDPAQVIFIISKNPYSTKPKVILNFSTLSLFQLWSTVHLPEGAAAQAKSMHSIMLVSSSRTLRCIGVTSLMLGILKWLHEVEWHPKPVLLCWKQWS